MKKLLFSLILVWSGSAWASFPTTSVIFTCTGANAGPPPSSQWTIITNGSSIVSNACVGTTSGENNQYWNVSSYGPDSEAYTTINTKGNSDPVWVGLRFNTTSGGQGYVIQGEVYATTILLQRIDSGNFESGTTIGTYSISSWSAGDAIGISAIGSNICAYYKPNAGSWTQEGCVTDTTYSGTGELYLDNNNSHDTTINFGGGTYISGGVASPSITTINNARINNAVIN